VDGYKKTRPKKKYGIEFERWEKWLGMNADSQFDEKWTIAHCLWEMTFFGFKQAGIQRKITDLNKMVKRIKDGKEKPIPFREAFPRSGKKRKH
jgi:hypothetical protein